MKLTTLKIRKLHFSNVRVKLNLNKNDEIYTQHAKAIQNTNNMGMKGNTTYILGHVG